MNRIKRSLVEFQEIIEEFNIDVPVPNSLYDKIKDQAIADGRIDLLVSTKQISHETLNLFNVSDDDLVITSGYFELNGIQFNSAVDVITYFRSLEEDDKLNTLSELGVESSDLLDATPYIRDTIDKGKNPIAFRFDGIDILESVATICDLVTLENKSTGNVYCTFKKNTDKKDHYKNIYKYHALALYFLDNSITEDDLKNMFHRSTPSEFRTILKSLGVDEVAIENYIKRQAN